MALVLIVEAEPASRALIRAQLAEAGHQVIAPDSAAGAVRDLTLLRPDVLVLDSVGLELDEVNRLAGARAGAALVLCTGVFDRGRLDLETLGAARVLTRPFSVGDVARAVEEVGL